MSCNDNVCGTGGWGGPKPGDPSNNGVLRATPAFGGIDLNWSFPTVNPFAVAHTRIFRAIIDDVNAALVLVDPAGGSFYYDKVPPHIEYFYWIQFVSINGTQGELIGPASAAARDSIENTIEELTGKIDAGMLAQALKTEIARIPEIDAKIFDEIENRLASNLALSNAIAQVQNVSDETKSFVLTEISQRQTADSALVASINTLFAQAAGNAAAINEERTVRVSKDDAIAVRLDTMAAALGPGIDASIAAAITEERTVRVAAEGALASDITTLFTKANANTAAINSEAMIRASAVEAQATQINDLYGKVVLVNDATTTVIQSAISSERGVRVAAEGALASDITTLFTRTGDNTAAIQTETTARSNAISAETASRNTQYAAVQPAINSAVAGEAAARNTAISAAVQTETNARVNADNALSGQITTAQSTLGGQISAVQTTLQTNIDTTNGKVTSIGALYTAKVSVNGLIGGFGVYNNGASVEAGFDVDTFWIGRTAANKRKPFIVVGNEVFIDQAFIGEEWVGTSNIKIANVDTLRIKDNAVTVPVGAFAQASSVSVSVYLDADYPVFVQASLTQSFYSYITLQRDGTQLWVEIPIAGTLASRGIIDRPGAGYHTYLLQSNDSRNTNGTSLFIQVIKR